VSLNEHGREQARAISDQVASESIAAIYSSDLRTARDTADIVGARLEVPVAVDPDLREIDVGAVESFTAEESEAFDGWQGEPHEAHSLRVLAAIDRIAARHPAERILVVTHGGSMRRVHEHLGLEGGPFENCAVWMCVHEDGALRSID